MSNTYQLLCDGGYTPSLSLDERKRLVTSEKGKKYSLELSDGVESACFQIDDYIVREGSRCDKLVLARHSEEAWSQVFVELKGKDVAHAIEQLRASLANPLFRHITNKHVKARIVAASFPANKSNPLMEKAKREFRGKPFCCELRGMKTGQIDHLA